jgi:hypothetical protein
LADKPQNPIAFDPRFSD